MAHKARNSRILRPQYCCGVITHLRILKNFYVSFIRTKNTTKNPRNKYPSFSALSPFRCLAGCWCSHLSCGEH